mgnify:FL=1
MPKLPVISGKAAVKKFLKIGYVVTRQKGSHVRLTNDNDILRKPFTIPLHKMLKPGLTHQLIKDAGLTIEEFLDL